MTSVTLEGEAKLGPGRADDRGLRRLAIAALAVALVLAVGIRLRAFTTVGGLFHDDTLLATNVVKSSESQPPKTLAFNQAAPVGHLLLLKGTTLISEPAPSPAPLRPPPPARGRRRGRLTGRPHASLAGTANGPR